MCRIVVFGLAACCLALFDAVGAARAAEPVRVACIGDSITAGVGTANPEWDAYPAQLQRMLGAEWLVYNFGNSGSTLLKQGNKPYQAEGALTGALNSRPGVVIVMLGTNDTKPENWKFKDQFAPDYKDLIAKFKALSPTPRIFVCRPCYAARVDDNSISETRVRELLPVVDTLAREEGVEWIDMHGVLEGKGELIPDGVHPNTAGAAELAKTAYAVLTGKPWQGPVPSEMTSTWNGFQKRDFFVCGRSAILVSPEKSRLGKPWIWRPQFFGAFPWVDLALLKEGYHVAYINLRNTFGAPEAIDKMDEFYDYLVRTVGLAPKPVIEGFSRGGLFSLNWAARNPGKVSALYLDAPVCDFNSWPGGKGKGKGSPIDWKSCLELYRLTEAEARNTPLLPLKNLKPIADAQIPIIAVAGDADDVVPMDENVLVLEKEYREFGGRIQVITRPGVGHHPHSLENPEPVVNFILTNAIP